MEDIGISTTQVDDGDDIKGLSDFQDGGKSQYIVKTTDKFELNVAIQ